MKMRFLLFIAAILLALTGFSQKNDPIKCSVKLPLLENDSVYIKGKQGKKIVNRKFFRKKFELTVSDRSYKIVGFYISWNDLRAKIYKRGNKGAKVSPEIEATKSEKEKYSLKNLEPGIVVAFDCIIVKRGNTYFQSRPVAYEIASR
jgi:hypothetical protein